MKACSAHYGKGVLNLRVKRIIPISELIWLLPVNSPTSVDLRKHVFPKGSNDRYTVREFLGTGFYQYFSRHSAQVKKQTFKT